jgi:acyl dehydratase
MLVVQTPADLDAWVGRELGVSDWIAVTQETIDRFAEATGDHQWIHVDQERARAEMPGGKTIAHGYLTLSLLPALIATIYRVERRSRALNYGANRVRFTAPVPSGARVRARLTLNSSEPAQDGRRLTSEAVVEIEGAQRPALVAEILTLIFD